MAKVKAPSEDTTGNPPAGEMSAVVKAATGGQTVVNPKDWPVVKEQTDGK